MADFSEKWGTDVDTAVQLALADLKLTIDEVDVTVLEEPSRGFFGIGSKLALVRVEKKKKPEEQQDEKTETSRKEHKEHKEQRKEQHRKQQDKEDSKETEQKAAAAEMMPEEDLKPCENHIALDFLKEITKNMGLDLEISAMEGEDSLYIYIHGKDSGTIIGKRGQTLDAIQYLTSLVANKDKEKYTRVVIDAEHYRAKREKTLEALAQRLATKVVKTRRSVKLEPMNPYERKVIHSTLQNNPKVVTRSEGQDPYRRVIIELKQ